MNSGKPLELEPIRPYAGFENPIPYEIPEELPDENGRMQSTTLGGTRPKGRVVLYTSSANMHTAYKNLQPRWKVTYRAQNEMLGSKSVAEFVPGVPGSYFIYATVELSALADYVDLGRRRPNDGPLIRAVPQVELEWRSSDRHVVVFERGSHIQATGKGKSEIWAAIPNSPIESPRITIEVWCVDHVLLTPRSLEIPLGKKQQILAEVTGDDGERSTNVCLNWTYEADDQLIVRIHPAGWVTGNRLGRTSITAGAGNPAEGGVWARISAEVTVVPNPEELKRGGGFPQLLLTDRDVDQDGNGRESNPDQPALWQERIDWMNNVWWLNLGAPDAAFFFNQRAENPTFWRAFHAQKAVEMVAQVHMNEEFTRLGEAERKDYWGNHKLSLETHQIRLSEPMWQALQTYVLSGTGLE